MTASSKPTHVAIILDGNGRWAKVRKMPRFYGHVKGANTAEKIIDACIENNIKVLTLFAFGMENWQRPSLELKVLMRLFYSRLKSRAKRFHQKNIRLEFIGQRELFSDKLQLEEAKAVALTKDNTALTLVFAASYSGQWDICQATKKMVEKVQNGELMLDEITPEQFTPLLATHSLPPVDLLIRTSGEQRLSNFLLWQCAYAELYFTQTLWPDFGREEFDKALQWYANRERRFGKTSQQVKEEAC